MKQKAIFYLLIVLLTQFNLFAQKEPELTVVLLDDDKIAEVNVDQDNYIKSVGKITDLAKKEFANIPETQKISILFISHKIGKPSIKLYSNPKINNDTEIKFLSELNSINVENTKFVDFPILISLNAKFEEIGNDFKDLILPNDKINQEYENADLKKKFELNKNYAINEVLPILSAYETIVDDKFAGVKNFGNLVTKTNFKENQDISNLTSTNSDYWRANMEMSTGNQLIPITKIFMLVSQGEFDYATKYIEIIRMFAEPKSISTGYLKELTNRLALFNEQLNLEVQKGIVEHDKGEYEKAISVYNGILKNYPNSAWTNYELYYSQHALNLKNEKGALNDREDWDKSKLIIYKNNPMYYQDVRANNGKEGYLLFRRQSISELFKSNDDRLSDVYKYADIAMDLGVYDFASQLFWFSFTFDKKNENSLYKFLYCIEKLGVMNLKENFKGDYKKEFKKIEKEKEKEMKESKIYKSFKN